MKKINIFLASSKELKAERERFEIEIYRKCKFWFDKDIFLHLDVWEDLPASMSSGGSQSEYNKIVRSADLFVLLAYTKLGVYTGEEFDNALGEFNATQKPFLFTYFKEPNDNAEASLLQFRQKLKDLHHFFSSFTDSDGLWNQFNKELDRLKLDNFEKHPEASNTVRMEGNGNIAVQGNTNSPVNIHTGNTTNQNAEKIYNIDKIEKADFS